MLPRSRTVALVMGLVAALALPAAASAKGGAFDMGDAPDGAKTGYSGGAATGSFPSKLASSGPRHSGLPGLRLGKRSDGESDSEQVNKDRHDDGAEPTLKSCSSRSKLELVLDGKGLSATQRAPGNVVYVNAWFDWNRDGDWDDADAGCAPEWAIQNLAVPAESLGSDGLRFLPIRFKAGRRPNQQWWRVTVTLNEPAIDPGGRGRLTPYSLGETEDFFTRTRGGGRGSGRARFTARCNPNPVVIPHGATAKVKFVFFGGPRKKPVYGRLDSPKAGKGYGVSLNPSPNQQGVPQGFTRAGGFSFKSSHIDPPARTQRFAVTFTFTRGKRSRQVDCIVVVVHEGKGGGKDKKKQPKFSAVRCVARCAGVIPARPGPVQGVGGRYEIIQTEMWRLELTGQPPAPVAGLQIPLGAPNPVPRDAPQLESSNPQAGCTTQALLGGPPVLDCRFPPQPQLDSFFQVIYPAAFGAGPLSGVLLDGAGGELGSFDAVRGLIPQVTGQGQFDYSGGANQVDFAVSFNTQLDQFLIDFPAGFQVQGGAAPGFNCQVGTFEGHIQGALICNGSVQPNQQIQGGLMLNQAHGSNVHAQSRLYGGSGGTLFGPFSITAP